MAHDVAGQGRPVVLLHSGIADRRMWQPQWEPLAESFRVIRCDLRGFGDTPIPPGTFSFSGDVIDLLDHLDVDNAAVVASSFGGLVALELAAGVPERVNRLVLLCTAFAGLEPTAAVQAFGEQEEALLAANDIDGAVELNVVTWLGPEADDVTRRLVRTMQRRAFDVQLAADALPEPPEDERAEVDPAVITCPTLVVTGGRDLDHFQAIADHLARAIPGARLLRLPWAGHLPSLERPDEVTALLISELTDNVSR